MNRSKPDPRHWPSLLVQAVSGWSVPHPRWLIICTATRASFGDGSLDRWADTHLVSS